MAYQAIEKRLLHLIYVRDRLRNFFFKATTLPNERELQTSLTTFKNLLKCRSCTINTCDDPYLVSTNTILRQGIPLRKDLCNWFRLVYLSNKYVLFLSLKFEGLSSNWRIKKKIANFYKIVGMKSNINKPFKIVIHYTPYYLLLLTMTMIFPFFFFKINVLT